MISMPLGKCPIDIYILSLAFGLVKRTKTNYKLTSISSAFSPDGSKNTKMVATIMDFKVETNHGKTNFSKQNLKDFS